MACVKNLSQASCHIGQVLLITTMCIGLTHISHLNHAAQAAADPKPLGVKHTTHMVEF